MFPFYVYALYCLAVAGALIIAIFFYYVLTSDRLRICFYVCLMIASVCLVVAGLTMMNRQATWEGIVLVCVGLALSLGTMVAAQKSRG